MVGGVITFFLISFNSSTVSTMYSPRGIMCSVFLDHVLCDSTSSAQRSDLFLHICVRPALNYSYFPQDNDNFYPPNVVYFAYITRLFHLGRPFGAVGSWRQTNIRLSFWPSALRPCNHFVDWPWKATWPSKRVSDV